MKPLNAPVDTDTGRLSGEQWLRVKSAFHEALSRPVEVREAFIRAGCQDDATLEAAIRSLLASDQSARDFLEAPAVARVGLPSDATATLTPGNRLGAYEIVELLGAGGMGEVYRARDDRLARDIAIKILRADVMHDGMHRQWL